MSTDSVPPKGFVALDIVPTRLDKDLNVIGIVTDFLPPVKSRGADYMCSFTLCDLSPSTGQLVKFFRPSIEALPQIRGNGDLVVLRQVQAKSWSGLNSLLSNRFSTWAVICGHSIPAKPPAPGSPQRISKIGTIPQLSAQEVIYGITLANALSHHRASEVIRPSPSRSLPPVPQLALKGRKFSLIKDVQIAKFCDIIGEVVKTFPNGSGLEVYVSDYTSNENLFNYEWSPPSPDDCGGPGDEYGYIGRRTNQSWPGPYGKLTLRVVLWPPHSTAAQSTIKEGDYVELRNVRIKFDRCTHLEGAIHGDRQFPDRIYIRRIDDKKDERYLAVLKRKRSYGKKFDKQKGDFLEEVGKSLKRPNDLGDEEDDISRKRLKKRRSEERKVAQNREESQVPRKGQPEEASGAWGLAQRRRTEEIKSERENKIATANLRFAVNKNVACAHLAKPVIPVSQILAGTGRTTATDTDTTLDLPFQNVCCRAKVRVVDFFPPNLEDFAVPCDEFEDLSDDSEEESDRDERQRRRIGSGLRRVDRWEWMFYLLVEDATSKSRTGSGANPETMKVLVADRDAECLLKMDAKDLRGSPDTLNLLREKLFILWGDLEERKSNSTSALKELNPNNKIGSIGDTIAKRTGGATRTDPRQFARAFECCIKEYGVLDRRRRQKGDATQGRDASEDEGTWLRRFRMFGTVINAL